MSHARRLPLHALLLAPLALAALASAGCVTRTVYVVDDRDAPPQASSTAMAPQSVPPRGVDLDDASQFYEPLSPYGSWHNHPRYGYVFAPAGNVVGAGWRPYTRGHWEYTEWGWTWVSDLPFGWATSHYGRWFYDGGLGWVWVPGRTWAPAWVTWRSGGGYVGWAPMPPGASYGGSYVVYDTAWVFVSTGHFGASAIYPVVITGSRYNSCLVSTRPYRTTHVYYGSTYYRGPDPNRVRREGGRVIHRSIEEVDRDRPVTRPPRGVQVTGHNGHSGSVGPRERPRDSASRPRPSDAGRGRPSEGSTGRPRDDAGASSGGRPSDRGSPGASSGGRPSDRGSPGRATPDDDRGGRQSPGRGGVRPRDGDDGPTPGRGSSGSGNRGGRTSGEVDGNSAFPTGPDGASPGRGAPSPGGRPWPGGGGGGGDQGGRPLEPDVERPDTRPQPESYPSPNDPRGGAGQAAPSMSGPASSRFERARPSRFGPQPQPQPQRQPQAAPNPSQPQPGYGAPPRGNPAPGYGGAPSYGAPSRGSAAPGYGSPAPRAAPQRTAPPAARPSAPSAPAPAAAPPPRTQSQPARKAPAQSSSSKRKGSSSKDDSSRRGSSRSRGR